MSEGEALRLTLENATLKQRVRQLADMLRELHTVGIEPPVDNGGHFQPNCTADASEAPCLCPACHMHRIGDVRRRAKVMIEATANQT